MTSFCFKAGHSLFPLHKGSHFVLDVYDWQLESDIVSYCLCFTALNVSLVSKVFILVLNYCC